jgi:hypothetical protein
MHCDGTTDTGETTTIRMAAIAKLTIIIRKLYVTRNSMADCAITASFLFTGIPLRILLSIDAPINMERR